MPDNLRDWSQVRVDAIKALIAAATDFGHDDIVPGPPSP